MKSKVRTFECVGGPLCGTRMQNHDRFVFIDSDGCTHYYRKIKVMKNDRSAIATFHHYFGTNRKRASRAHPYLLPGERSFRPVV